MTDLRKLLIEVRDGLDAIEANLGWPGSENALKLISQHKARIDAALAEKDSNPERKRLICPLCEADRYKEPCRGSKIIDCPMAGKAAHSALAEPVEPVNYTHTEFFWVVEKKEHGTVFYWQGTCDNEFKQWEYSTKVTDAVRFPSKAAAEIAIRMCNLAYDYADLRKEQNQFSYYQPYAAEHGLIHAAPAEQWRSNELKMHDPEGQHYAGEKLDALESQPVPVEPDEVSEMRSYRYRQAEIVMQYIDSLQSALKLAQGKADALERDDNQKADANRELWIRAEKAEAVNRRMVELMKEPSEGMIAAGYPPNDERAQSWDVTEVFKAMSAELLKEMEK